MNRIVQKSVPKRLIPNCFLISISIKLNIHEPQLRKYNSSQKLPNFRQLVGRKHFIDC